MGLVIYDTWRPLQVQQALFNTYYSKLKTKYSTMCKKELYLKTQNYVSIPSENPKFPSPHYTGEAVDLSLMVDGKEIFMGTEFDSFEERAHTSYFEGSTSLEFQQVVEYRRLLYKLMAGEGFSNYPYEWWHYDYGNQFWAKQSGNKHAIYSCIKPK